MSDIGIKVSQPNKDVENAADFELLLSSSFPLLKIHDTGTINVSSESSQDVVHGLGYPPMFLVYRDWRSTSNSIVRGDFSTFASYTGLCNSNILRIANNSTSNGTYRYYIFRQPINQDFTGSTASLDDSQTSSVDRDYGIKVSKPGSTTDSSDLRDYAIHSGTRSPIIHSTQHETKTSSGDFDAMTSTLTHNLGYTPLGFAYYRTEEFNSNFYNIVTDSAGAGGPAFFLGENTIELTVSPIDSGSTVDFSLVCLKDPFDKEEIQVTY